MVKKLEFRNMNAKRLEEKFKATQRNCEALEKADKKRSVQPGIKVGVEEIKWRELDIKKLRKGLPELKKTLAALEKAEKVSSECLEARITI
jgi:hypothetical protein